MSKKPYPEFPLTAHPSGRWCKKVKGKMYYFGPLEASLEALQRWLDQRDLIYSGSPLRASEGLRLGDLVNLWLESKEQQVDKDLLSPKTWTDYHQLGKLMVGVLGKGAEVAALNPSSFRLLRHKIAEYAPSVQVRMVTITRMVFKWGREHEICEEVSFGPDFKPPSKKMLRVDKANKPKRLFTAEQIHTLLKGASMPLKAMTLLGINGGLGNTDLSQLTSDSVLPDRIHWHRAKTGISRTIPLWRETEEAVRPFVGRHKLLFITAHGNPWVRVEKNKTIDSISREFSKLLVKCELKQPGLGFYTLRHTFQTIGDQTKDPLAVPALMGHIDGSISGHYREGIEFDRLKAVTDYVRGWLHSEDVP